MKDSIRLASRKDISLIQQYIRINWSENHIFTKNKDLFFGNTDTLMMKSLTS